MTDFETVSDSPDARYRFIEAVRMIGAFYVLWYRSQLGDWDAYREMLSERFPAMWTQPSEPQFLFADESQIPAEFIRFPIDDDMTDEQKHEYRAVFVPDEYSISLWLSDLDKGDGDEATQPGG
jgi:hypothetical protein